MTFVELGKVAYETYAQYTGWKNFQGTSMPQWDDLPESIRNAWVSASAGITDAVLKDVDAATKMANEEIVPQHLDV